MSKSISWRCPNELKIAIDNIATKKNISVSSILNIAVNEFIDRQREHPMFSSCYTGVEIPDCDLSDEFLKKYKNKTDKEIAAIRLSATKNQTGVKK